MKPSSPIPQPIQFKPGEYSGLRSQRDKGSPGTQWKQQASYASQLNALTEAMKVMWRELNTIKQFKLHSLNLHPFKIYNTPRYLYNTPDPNSLYWRTFKVRSGLVLTDLVSTSSMVFGTDRITYPDYDFIPLPVATGDILVPESTPAYWFWVETLNPPLANTGSYILRHGTNPAVSSAFNPTPWTTFPSSSANHIPIGFVDTNTSGSINRAYVRQMLRTDVIAMGNSYTTMSVCVDGDVQTWYVDAYRSGSE